jgi:guanylate kinase
VDEEEFRKMIEGGEFVEWAQVHGNFYGTSKRRLEEATCAGYDVLLDIDVQGARQLKRVYPESVHIFILPPSMQELRRRLTGRMSDSEAEAERRLKKARDEVKEYRSYEYVIVNNDLEQALVLLSSILLAERARIGRADCHWINETFL